MLWEGEFQLGGEFKKLLPNANSINNGMNKQKIRHLGDV